MMLKHMPQQIGLTRHCAEQGETRDLEDGKTL